MNQQKYFNQINSLLFWDTKKEDLLLEKDSFYIIKRVITQGDKKDRDLLFQIYTKQEIREVVSKTRELSDQLKEIWLKILK